MQEHGDIPTIADLLIELEPEVHWDDVAPLAQDLQDNERAGFVSVRRAPSRPGVGGPGFDIVPILITIVLTTTLTSLVQETVRDVIYPFLKDRLYTLYSKLPGVTATGTVKPLGLTLKHSELEAHYRFSEGLDKMQLDRALRAVPDHFETIAGRGNAVVMLDYDARSGTWVENREAGEFLTWSRQRQDETAGPAAQ
jgi:hypothetical protein